MRSAAAFDECHSFLYNNWAMNVCECVFNELWFTSWCLVVLYLEVKMRSFKAVLRMIVLKAQHELKCVRLVPPIMVPPFFFSQ